MNVLRIIILGGVTYHDFIYLGNFHVETTQGVDSDVRPNWIDCPNFFVHTSNPFLSFHNLTPDFKFLSTFSPSQVGECRNMYLFSCVLIMYYMSAYPGPFIELPPLTSTLSCLDSWRLKGRMEYIWIITEVGLLSMPGLLTISEIEAIDRSELYVIFLSDPSFFMTKQWIGRQPSYLWNEGFKKIVPQQEQDANCFLRCQSLCQCRNYPFEQKNWWLYWWLYSLGPISVLFSHENSRCLLDVLGSWFGNGSD